MGKFHKRDQGRYVRTQLECISFYHNHLRTQGERLTPDEAAERWAQDGHSPAFQKAYRIYQRKGLDREDSKGLYNLTNRLVEKQEKRRAA